MTGPSSEQIDFLKTKNKGISHDLYLHPLFFLGRSLHKGATRRSLRRAISLRNRSSPSAQPWCRLSRIALIGFFHRSGGCQRLASRSRNLASPRRWQGSLTSGGRQDSALKMDRPTAQYPGVVPG